MVAFLCFAAAVTALLHWGGGGGWGVGGGGGAWAYDGHSTCARPFRGRADGGGGGADEGPWPQRPPPRPPCDFQRQSWCTVPGSAYPWHAVRRFVQENHGLMRRMYGEQRHLSVLRAELIDSENLVEGPEPTPAGAAATGAGAGRPSASPTPPTPPARDDEAEARLPPVDISAAPAATSPAPAGPAHGVADPTEASDEWLDDETTTEYVSTENASWTEGSTLWDAGATEDATEAPASSTASPSPQPSTAAPSSSTRATPPASVTPTASSTAPTQLFQDVRGKDREPVVTPQLRIRGVNACPVKEEVVAPFWANNTRGEVLALLNLYPFEQYVHWEKCTYELKQMYCREGCRCEQQYRLHRLLAYDPNNECRGIFSDWFKFPSCCVCRCYDLPMELQLTSRSPRHREPPPPPPPPRPRKAKTQRPTPSQPPPLPAPAAETRWYRGTRGRR